MNRDRQGERKGKRERKRFSLEFLSFLSNYVLLFLFIQFIQSLSFFLKEQELLPSLSISFHPRLLRISFQVSLWTRSAMCLWKHNVGIPCSSEVNYRRKCQFIKYRARNRLSYEKAVPITLPSSISVVVGGTMSSVSCDYDMYALCVVLNIIGTFGKIHWTLATHRTGTKIKIPSKLSYVLSQFPVYPALPTVNNR